MTAIMQLPGDTNTVIQLSGRLDIRNASELKSQILKSIDSDLQLIIRLNEADWIDASIAQILIAARNLGALIELGVGNSTELVKLLVSTRTLSFSNTSDQDNGNGE